MPDLFDKLTLDLQRATLPFYTSAKSLQELMNHCLALDQGLRRIRARSDRLKARTATSTDRNNSARAPVTTRNLLASSQDTPEASTRPYTRGSTPVTTTTPGPVTTPYRRLFNNPHLQALSDRKACFSCGQPGHIAANCPTNSKDSALVVQEVDGDADDEAQSGKEEP